MNADFAARLCRAMAQMENPKKDKTAQVPTKSGGKYSYKYTQLDDVLGAIRPPLLAEGIMLLQGVFDDKLVCAVADGTESVVLDQRPFRPTGDPQSQGSYETYMRRYQLLTAFGLCGEDDDGAAATYQKRTQQPTQAASGQAAGQPKQMWDQLLEAFYGKVNELGYDANDVWGQMSMDVGFSPTPSITQQQFQQVMGWIGRMQ